MFIAGGSVSIELYVDPKLARRVKGKLYAMFLAETKGKSLVVGQGYPRYRLGALWA